MTEPNINDIKDESLYAPLHEDTSLNTFYEVAKNNIKESKRWAYIIGILGCMIIFFALVGVSLRYIFMRYEFEQAPLYKWILGFIFNFSMILLGIFAILSSVTSRFATLRLYFSSFFLIFILLTAVFGIILNCFGILLWGNAYPKQGAFAVIETIISICMCIILWVRK